MFKLDLESEAEFRKYVRELISGQVRSILRAELAGIVNAEIVKLRLLQPGDTTLSQLVAKQVDNAVAIAVKHTVPRTADMVRDQIQAAIKETIAPLVKDINLAVREQLIKAIRSP